MFLQPITSEEFQKHWKVKFFTIFAGQSLSLFGSALVQFALIWHLTRETGSATILAYATLFGMLPQILLGPIAGTVADRYNRRLVMIVSDSLIALSTLVLVLLFASDLLAVWHIYAALFVRSLGGAFHFPAMSASTSLMVPKEHLARVAGIRQMLMGAVTIVAPPVGALLIEAFAMEYVLMIDVATALIAVIPLIIWQIPQPERGDMTNEQGTRPSFFADMRAGLRYMFEWKGLFGLALLATVLNFIMAPISALMPIMVTQEFGKGALELGLTDSVFGIGMILGGLLLGVWGGFKRKIMTSLTGIVGFSLGIFIQAAAPAEWFWMLLLGMGMVGFLVPIVNGPIHALLQTVVRQDMQGRVMSLLSSMAIAMMPLSLMIAGPIADWLGARAWFWISGVLNLSAALVALSIPAILHIEDNHNEGGAPAEAIPAD
jgi:MFS transporter, DHA3 family, macrolide efflux protein